MHRRSNTSTRKNVVIQTLESRLLLAGQPLLIDFGQSGSPTTYSNIASTYVAGSTITTPAHQNGGVSNTYDVYNNVTNANSTSLVWGDGTAATGVTLNWGAAATDGGTVSFASTAGLSVPSITAPNSANMEFDNGLYNDSIIATAREEGVQISGLAVGTYYVYFTNNRTASTNIANTFGVEIGANLTNYDNTQAQFEGGLKPDGMFTAPGDYVVAKVTLNAGDSLVILSHSYGGSFDTSTPPNYITPTNKFNVLEIVPTSAGTDSTLTQATQSTAYRGAAPAATANLDAFGQWTGDPSLYGEDFLGTDTWANMTSNISWLTTPWKTWVDAQAGRRLILGVGMLPSNDGSVSLATGAGGSYNTYFQTLATNLITNDLGNSIIRLGWEFNGGWYKWAAYGQTANFITYWQKIVNTMRAVTVAGKTNALQFVFNPVIGTQQFDASLAYPGDAYVDYIGLDVYDQSYLANTYPFQTGSTPYQIESRQEVAVNNLLTETDGMNFWSNFASNHTKPFSIPEWGTDNTPDQSGGLDDSFFVSMMHAFISNPGNHVSFNVYFDVDVSDGDHELSPGADGTFETEFPQAASAYRTLFDGVPSTVANNIDIGSPTPAGNASFNPVTNAWTVVGGGSNIYGTSDQFHYVSNSVTGDQTLIARVASLTNTSTAAKAGVMMRDGTAANAMFVDVVLSPGTGISFQYRTTTGGSANGVSVAGVSGSAWVKLVRSGNNFYAFYATTIDRPSAGDWIALGEVTAALSSTYQSGLAVTSHNTASLCSAVFTDYTSTANSALPSGWSAADVGSPGVPGSSFYDWDNYSVQGSGSNIGSTADQFQYLFKSVTGNQILTARLDSVSSTTSASKSGIMFRDSTATGSMMVDLVMLNTGSLAFQWRSSTNGTMNSGTSVSGLGLPTPADPLWLRIVRNGTSYTAYYAQGDANPTSWMQIGTSQTVSFGNSTYLAGAVVSSGANTAIRSASFCRLTCTINPVGLRMNIRSTGNNTNYVTADGTANEYLGATASSSSSTLAQFDIVDAGNGYIALRNVSTGNYVSVDSSDSNKLKANTAGGIGLANEFTLTNLVGGGFALFSVSAGKYIGRSGNFLLANTDLTITNTDIFNWSSV